MKWKDDDPNAPIDWPRIYSTAPQWDEAAQDHYIPLSPREMAAVEKLCAVVLCYRFREYPDHPLEMQRENDRAWQEHVRKNEAKL